MKHYQHIIAWAAIIFLASFASPSCHAHYAVTGIKFMNGSFQEILNTANEQSKYVFVHTTSSKCKPCSMFASDYYTDAEVSNFYNANFLNYTLNIDDPAYGNFARMNDLGTETELLFYNSNGFLMDRTSGSEVQNKRDLLNKGLAILKGRTEDSWNEFTTLKEKYKKDKSQCSPTDLYKLTYLSHTFGDPYNNLVNEYLNTQRLEEKSSDINRTFIYDFSDNVSNIAMTYFLADLQHYKRNMRGEQVNNRIKLAIQNTLKTVINNRDKELFDKMLDVIKSANLSNDKDYELNVKAEYYEQISDWNNLYKVTKEHIAFKHDDPRLLNDAAERFFKYARDKNKEDLKLALSWAKQSVGYESECYNNFTLGKLYNALNDKDMALATFEKCIEIGKLGVFLKSPFYVGQFIWAQRDTNVGGTTFCIYKTMYR